MGLHLLLLLNACERGFVWFKLSLQPLLNCVFNVLLQRLVILALGLGVVEVKLRGVWHSRPGVRLNAELVLSQHCHGLRQLAELLAYRVIRLRGRLWSRRRRTPLRLRLRPFYRAMLEAPTIAIAVVYPRRRGFGLLLDLLGD